MAKGNRKSKRNKNKKKAKASSSKTSTGPITLRVPEDCRTLNEAMERARADRRICTVELGKGQHRVKNDPNGTNYLWIDFPITIIGVGDNNEVVVLGGFFLLF